MGRYILRRIIQGIPTFFGVTIISFILMVSAPGDPIRLITWNPASNPEQTEALRRRLGLDQPALVQYVYWLVGNDWVNIDTDGDGEGDTYGTRQGLLRGDLGESLRQRQSVLDLIVERIPATLQLTLSALVVGYLVGILLGVLAASYQGSIIDQLVRVVSVIGNAIPAFWLGLILIIVFSVNLDILPMGGMRDIASSGGFDLMERLRHLALPVGVLSLSIIANISRYTRTSMLEVIGQDYVRTAQAKGLSSRTITWRHVIRNALLPVATFLGPALGGLLGGAVIVEQVFSWPGMGRLVVDSVFTRDYPIVMGSVVVGSVLFIFGLLISDILYGLLDPRISFR